MKITIVHLYYDLLNLYGESGNVKALKKVFEDQGIETEIRFLTITDQLTFDDVNIVFVGAGTEQNQKTALKHLNKYKKDIEKAYKNGTFFLATGNALELFGSSIIDQSGKKWNALKLFKFHAKEEPFRIVDEALFKTNLIPEYILGFQNQNSVVKDLNKEHLFEVIKGTGSYPKSKSEGIHVGNFYGTYLIGPLLVRNPALLKYIAKEILSFYYPNYILKPFSMNLEENAYNTFMNNYYKEYTK